MITAVTSGRLRSAALSILASLALVGCASGPAPHAELRASALALAVAETADPEGRAGAELAAARGKYHEAEAAVRAGDHDRAWQLAVEAEAEARLAEARARAAMAEARLAAARYRDLPPGSALVALR